MRAKIGKTEKKTSGIKRKKENTINKNSKATRTALRVKQPHCLGEDIILHSIMNGQCS